MVVIRNSGSGLLSLHPNKLPSDAATAAVWTTLGVAELDFTGGPSDSTALLCLQGSCNFCTLVNASAVICNRREKTLEFKGLGRFLLEIPLTHHLSREMLDVRKKHGDMFTQWYVAIQVLCTDHPQDFRDSQV